MSLSPPLPKAVLYYNPRSVWSSAVLLCLEEKGYGEDELELRVVNLDKGENFAPAFLRISPKGTLPTLVVPLDKTLSPNVPHRYKALTSTETILEFLDKSRSSSSSTKTTSSSPAPALKPATVSLGDVSNGIIRALHSSPTNFLSLAAINQEELISKSVGPEGDFVRLRHALLEEYLKGEDAPEVAKTLWQTRFYENEPIMRVYMSAEISVSNLEPQQVTEREAFFKQSRNSWKEIKHVLQLLEKQIMLPYTLGDQLSLVDLHIAAWFTRILHLIKAPYTPSKRIDNDYVGFNNLQETIRRYTGDAHFVIENKLRSLGVAIMNRKSWQKVYKEGLH